MPCASVSLDTMHNTLTASKPNVSSSDKIKEGDMKTVNMCNEQIMGMIAWETFCFRYAASGHVPCSIFRLVPRGPDSCVFFDCWADS